MRVFFRKNESEVLQAYIDPPGRAIPVARKQTLLQAALAADIAFPHSCRVGSCTTCKCRLLDGRIKALTDASYVLSAEELRAGYILACQSVAKTDVRIALDRLDAAPTSQAKIRRLRFLTHDILELAIALETPLQYIAGQYAEIVVPDIHPPRCYSFAAAPQENGCRDLVFHVRLVPGGEISQWLQQHARAGTAVGIRGPLGVFRLHGGEAPILCVAGGSGMAPIKAMLEQAQRAGWRRPVRYLYGARTQRDLYCLAEIAELARSWNGHFQFTPVLSAEPEDSDWQGARGLVTEWIDRHGPAPSACQAYLCGPPGMVDAAVAVLTAAGAAKENIHFDKFLDRSHAAVL